MNARFRLVAVWTLFFCLFPAVPSLEAQVAAGHGADHEGTAALRIPRLEFQGGTLGQYIELLNRLLQDLTQDRTREGVAAQPWSFVVDEGVAELRMPPVTLREISPWAAIRVIERTREARRHGLEIIRSDENIVVLSLEVDAVQNIRSLANSMTRLAVTELLSGDDEEHEHEEHEHEEHEDEDEDEEPRELHVISMRPLVAKSGVSPEHFLQAIDAAIGLSRENHHGRDEDDEDEHEHDGDEREHHDDDEHDGDEREHHDDDEHGPTLRFHPESGLLMVLAHEEDWALIESVIETLHESGGHHESEDASARHAKELLQGVAPTLEALKLTLEEVRRELETVHQRLAQQRKHLQEQQKQIQAIRRAGDK